MGVLDGHELLVTPGATLTVFTTSADLQLLDPVLLSRRIVDDEMLVIVDAVAARLRFSVARVNAP